MSKRLTYKRAVEINSAMLAISYARMGLELNPGKPLPSLKGYSLADMVEAAKIIKAREDEEAKTRPEGAAYSIAMVCDDRLVAALYAAENYDRTGLCEECFEEARLEQSHEYSQDHDPRLLVRT